MELAHISVGCNRVANSLDWSPAGRVAYGAHNAVTIYDVEVCIGTQLAERAPAQAKLTMDACQAAKVLATLHGHTARVNCVRWLEPAGALLAARHVAESFDLVQFCALQVNAKS